VLRRCQPVEQRVGIGCDVDRLEPVGDRPGRLQAVAGDEQDDSIVLAHAACGYRLTQGAERDARRCLAEYS
jgi:hypothetical protein